MYPRFITSPYYMNKLIIIAILSALAFPVFASEEVILNCDTRPNGTIKVLRDNKVYKVDITKQGKNILIFSKDYKKNTKNNFIKFNYSWESDLVSAGIIMGYLGKTSSLHSIVVNGVKTNNITYDINSNDILTCIKNENFINKFSKLDKEKVLPAFYSD